MQINDVKELLSRINGCTFASLDAETMPKPGLKCITTGESVILFTNKKSSGYENMVKRRLAEAGLNPASFSVDALPWGERIKNTPMIIHNGKTYLQCIVLSEGKNEYFVGRYLVNPKDWGLRASHPNQGLPEDTAVKVRTYEVNNITRLSLLGETVKVAERKILTIK